MSVSLFNTNTFTTPLAYRLHFNHHYPAHANRQLEQKLHKARIEYPELETKFDDKTGVLSRTPMFLFIPIYAVIFYTCFFRWRRYFAEQVIVTTHFWCLVMLLLAVAVSSVVQPAVLWSCAPTMETVFAAHDGAVSIRPGQDTGRPRDLVPDPTVENPDERDGNQRAGKYLQLRKPARYPVGRADRPFQVQVAPAAESQGTQLPWNRTGMADRDLRQSTPVFRLATGADDGSQGKTPPRWMSCCGAKKHLLQFGFPQERREIIS